MEAMQVELEDWYPSVEAFRVDLQRYLDGRPVSARAANRAEGMWRAAGTSS